MAGKRVPMTDTKRLLLMLEALRLAVLHEGAGHGTTERGILRSGSEKLSTKALKGLGR